MVKVESIIVICCFCEESLPYENAVHISIDIAPNREEKQWLFSHKECFNKVLHKNVVRHPDLFNDHEISI